MIFAINSLYLVQSCPVRALQWSTICFPSLLVAHDGSTSFITAGEPQVVESRVQLRVLYLSQTPPLGP